MRTALSYDKLLDHYLSFMHLGAFGSYAENTRRRDVRVARAASEGMHEKRTRLSTHPLSVEGRADCALIPLTSHRASGKIRRLS